MNDIEKANNLLVKESIDLPENFEITKEILETQLSELQKRYDELKESFENYVCGHCTKTIVGVSHYHKYGDRFTFFEQGMNFDNLDLSDYDVYQEYCMCLVYLLGQARIKFEKQSSEKMRKAEMENNIK